MSKVLKRYDETTGEWIIVSAPDVSVVQQIEGGSDISDTNVIVTNYNYIDGEGRKTLNDTLTDINDDISKLQRNVSWLAEHGGGGGGQGGGSIASYGIEVDTPNVVNGGAVYLRKEEAQHVQVIFRITGGSAGDICKFAYQYDNDPQSPEMSLEVDKNYTLNFDNTQSTLKEHHLIIRATNPYNGTISPFKFNIYESSLAISFGGELINNIFYIEQNDTSALIPIKIINGLVGSDTVIVAECRGLQTTLAFKSTTTSEQVKNISFWDIIPQENVDVGSGDYLVKVYGQAKLGNNEIEDPGFLLRVRINDPSEITIMLGANGDGVNDVPFEVEQDSTLNYNFKISAPADTKYQYLYYAAKIVNGSNSYRILGKFYDSTLHEDGSNDYKSNQTVKRNGTINRQYTLSANEFAIGDTVTLYVKAWSNDGSVTKEVSKLLTIIPASKSFWPRQYEDRSGNNVNPNTMFASWNKKNVDDTDTSKWTSRVTNYSYISNDLKKLEGTNVILEMNVIDGNDASGMQSAGEVPYLRLQNHAYSTVNFGKYYEEIKLLTMNGRQSFTISVTVNADAMAGTNHTLMLWGQNNFVDDTINNGIRIDADKIYWAYRYETDNGQIASDIISCNMPQGIKTTIDFSYSFSDEGSTVKIYKNGVLNAIKNIKRLDDSLQYVFPDTVYFGVNKNGDSFENFSDMDLLEFSIYTKVLNDIQIVVNSKNARLEGAESNNDVIADYQSWLIKNFIPSPEASEQLTSTFFDNGKYITGFTTQTINNIKMISNIPTITLTFGDSVGFTESYFYSTIDDTTLTGNTYECEGTYYDPSAGQSDETNMRLNVSLQGTSTLLYRVKNLEIRMAETVTIDGDEVPILFQPKPTWFPEKQFTLKADVVDSAHANNAVIGEWINTYGKTILADNPSMAALSDETRPKDVDLNGNVMEHRSSQTNLPIDYDENVTIKHTLEGFPCLLFIKFSNNPVYTFVGIYSFNLGRYSYYNMGMKFLDCFSRRDETGAMKSCPAKIMYYKEKASLGSINASDIYSFEFDNDGNENSHEHPMWSQFDMSIIQSLGDFKFPEYVASEDSIWTGLQNLFSQTSHWLINSYYGYQPTYVDESGDSRNIFDPIYYYKVEGEGSSKRYTQVGSNPISQNNDNYTELASAINIQNAAAYFMIANAFGMTDSLGKNMTLRSWDGGRSWWCCFYDMDTALGIANDGTESILVTVLMDKLSTIVDPETKTTTISTSYHDDNSQFGQHLSKLWGILRSDSFLYSAGRTNTPYYESIWEKLRRSDGPLSSPDNFTALMNDKINTCGEIVFNYDYDAKYVQKPDSEQGDATKFLHGTRIDYVKDWLRKHFYYLDGAFDSSNYPDISKINYVDSPYYKDVFTCSVNYTTGDRLTYTVKVTTPSFLKISVGNAEAVKVYIDTENQDTPVYIPNTSSPNSQMTVKGASVLSKFDGLQGGFQKIGSNANGVVKALSDFNVSTSANLLQDPVANIQALVDVNDISALESIDLSGTRLIDKTGTYKVDLSHFHKLLSVNVRNSDVTSLVLPNTALDRLYVSNSNITDLTLTDQTKLSSVDLTGCNKLNSIKYDRCNKFTGVTITDKQNLQSVNISSCAGLEEVFISGCTNLTSVEIQNNPSLKKITIADCTAANLDIQIIGSPLEDIRLSRIDSTVPIRLPEREYLSGVTRFEVRNITRTSGYYYGNEPIETYGPSGDYVLDLTPMTSLKGENLFVVGTNVKYARFENVPDNPVSIYSKTFERSDSLVRIFGHIKIEENCFYGKNNFYLNHDAAYQWTPNGVFTDYSNVDFETEIYNTNFDMAVYSLDGISPLFVNDSNYTNVAPITAKSISGWFSNTRCDIHDVYYILSLCGEQTENVSDLFAGCTNVVTYDGTTGFLDINTFAKCTNVSNINGIFRGCQIDGYIFEPLLRPLIDNLEEFSNVFSGKYNVVTEVCFFPVGCGIKKIEGFNPNKEGPELIDSHIFENLHELTTIINSFNDCSISFYGGRYDATEMFRNNVNLVEIKDSFVNISGQGSIANLFGGYSDEVGKYPSALTSVIHSFVFNENCWHDPGILHENDGGTGVLLPLGNSFFKRVKGTLRYVTGSAPGSNNTYDDNWKYGSSTSFSGPGLLKFLSNFDAQGSSADGYPGMNDCGTDDFPYGILDGCVNLVECPGLFEHTHNFKDYDIIEDKEAVITINPLAKNGVSIFKDCKKLQNISRFFRGMSNSIHCTLEGNALKDCEIVNAEGIFNDVYVVGKIPFHLFYEEGEKEYTVQGLTSDQAIALGISDDEGDLVSISEGQYSVYTGMTKYPKKTIKRLAYAIAGVNVSPLMSGYSVDNNEFENVICEDPDYSPFEYVLNGTHYSRNQHKYKYMWDKFAYDGSSDFLTRLQNSSVWQRDDIDKSNLPAEFVNADVSDVAVWTLENVKAYTGFNILTQDKANLFKKKNYFCPPDIFRCCENSQGTNITYSLSNVCGTFSSDNGNETITGSIGRVPEFIFEPVNEVTSLAGMFQGNKLMLPEKWGSSATDLGIVYPANILSGMTKLEDLSYMFGDTIMWKFVVVPPALLASNGNTITSLSNLWQSVKWIEREGTYNQISVDNFAGCSILQDVSGMFSNSMNYSIPIMTQIFTYSNNRLISNCSAFMYYASGTLGNAVPTFWKDWPVMNGNSAFLGILGEYSYQAMRERFVNWESTVPAEYYTKFA